MREPTSQWAHALWLEANSTLRAGEAYSAEQAIGSLAVCFGYRARNTPAPCGPPVLIAFLPDLSRPFPTMDMYSF